MPWWFFGFPYIFGYNRSENVEKELIIIIKASLLKNVYERQKLSKADVINTKSSLVKSSDLQFKKQLPGAAQFVTNETNKFQALNTSVLINNPNEHDNTKSNPTQSINTNKNAHHQKKYSFGKIKKINNQFVLIQWFKTCDADELYGKKLPVVRTDNIRNKIDNIGIVQIVETRNNSSVGKKIRQSKKFKIGDYLVVQK